MDLGNVATLKILWTEIANNMGRRPRIPPSGSLSHSPPPDLEHTWCHRTVFRNYFLYCITLGTTRPVKFPGRRKNGKQSCSRRTRQKDCFCLAVVLRQTCRRGALLNRLIAPSPHVLDKQVGRSDIGMRTRQHVPVQWARRPAPRDSDRPPVSPLLERAAGFGSGLEMRRESRAGPQDRRQGACSG